MEDTDKDILDSETNSDLKEAMEQTKENLEASKPEVKEEPQEEISKDSTPQEDKKEEVQEEKPEPKIETASKEEQNKVLAALIAKDKQNKELKQELKQLKEKSQNAETKEEREEVSSDLEEVLNKFNLDDNAKEVLRAITNPMSQKINNLEGLLSKFTEQEKVQKQEKEINDYFNNEFSKLENTIKTEHKDISDTELLGLKQKIINKAKEKGVTDLELIYRGVEEFRPQKDIRTAESNNSKINSNARVIDKNNPSMKDIDEMTDDERVEFLQKNSLTGY